jgi:hypothetical protein
VLPNIVWAAIVVAALAALTLASWRLNRAAFLIVVCHNAVWAGALVLIGTNLITYKESSWVAWLTLVAGLVAFNVGAWIARRPLGRLIHSQREVSTRVEATSNGALVSRRTLLVLVVIYALAFGAYMINIAVRFGLFTLITDPGAIRGFKGISYLASVPFPIRVFLYVGPLLFVIFGYKAAMEKPLPLWLRAVAMIVLAVTMIALLQRTNLFMGVLWLLAILISQPRNNLAPAMPGPNNDVDGASRRRQIVRRRGRIVLGVVGCLVIAFVAFQGIGGALHKTGQQALSTGAVSAPLAGSGLTSPFTYYTAGSIAFLQLVDSDNYKWPPVRTSGEMTFGDYNPQTWGASTFAPVLKTVPGARPWDSTDPFVDTGVLTNVYTWLEPYYRDFRLPGVIVAMLLLGFFIAWLYQRRAKSPRVLWIQSAFLSTVFLATFATKINNTLFLSELVLVLLLTVGRPKGTVGTWIIARLKPGRAQPAAPSRSEMNAA